MNSNPALVFEDEATAAAPPQRRRSAPTLGPPGLGAGLNTPRATAINPAKTPEPPRTAPAAIIDHEEDAHAEESAPTPAGGTVAIEEPAGTAALAVRDEPAGAVPVPPPPPPPAAAVRTSLPAVLARLNAMREASAARAAAASSSASGASGASAATAPLRQLLALRSSGEMEGLREVLASGADADAAVALLRQHIEAQLTSLMPLFEAVAANRAMAQMTADNFKATGADAIAMLAHDDNSRLLRAFADNPPLLQLNDDADVLADALEGLGELGKGLLTISNDTLRDLRQTKRVLHHSNSAHSVAPLLIDHKTQLEAAEQMAARLEEEHNAVVQRQEGEIGDLNAKLTLAGGKMADCEIDISALKAAAAVLQARLDHAKEGLTLAEDKIGVLRKDKDRRLTRIRQLKLEKTEEADKAAEKLTFEVGKLEALISAVQVHSSNHLSALHTAEAELKAKERTLKKVGLQAKTLQGQLEEVQSELAAQHALMEETKERAYEQATNVTLVLDDMAAGRKLKYARRIA